MSCGTRDLLSFMLPDTIRLDPKATTALDWYNELAQFQVDL